MHTANDLLDLQRANARNFRNAQTESVGRAVVTALFESCGRGCNRAFGEVRPNTMNEKKDTFFV